MPRVKTLDDMLVEPRSGNVDSDLLSWVIDIDVFQTPTTESNWNTLMINNGVQYNAFLRAVVQNAYIGFDIVLSSGVWEAEVTYIRNSDTGVIHLSVDNVPNGTIDTYGSFSLDAIGKINNIVINETSKKRLLFTVATKNTSSSGYGCFINNIKLRRTE